MRPGRRSAIRSALEGREAAFGDERWPTAVLSNHDRPRHASRLAASAGAPDPDAVARAAAVLLLTVRGTPFLYYGEEIGMRDVEVPPEESVDPPAFRFGPGSQPVGSLGLQDADAMVAGSRRQGSRPAGRGSASGRTSRCATSRPSERIPRSILSTYRRLLALRAATPALQVGSLRLHPAAGGDLVAYTREVPGQRILVLLNAGREEAGWDLAETGGASGVAAPARHRRAIVARTP